MGKDAREEILEKLKAGRRNQPPPRPPAPPLAELSWTQERMIEEFTQNLALQTAVVHRASNYQEAADVLAEIIAAEGIKRIAVSNDAVLNAVDVQEWGRKHGVAVLLPGQYQNRDEYKRMIFDDADAGVTGADFAVAESGTICIVHDKNQPRLISLAPIMHIVLVPTERLYPVYEGVIERIFAKSRALPSQVSFITGPSMTADIQGVPFKGMHGPKKLAVILVG